MKHLTLPRFWRHYRRLPKEVQELADKNFGLLKSEAHHPSLRLKKVGKTRQLWSVRVGAHYRALGGGSQRALCGSGSAHMPSMTHYCLDPLATSRPRTGYMQRLAKYVVGEFGNPTCAQADHSSVEPRCFHSQQARVCQTAHCWLCQVHLK